MKITLSCEFFPVATTEGAQKLAEVRKALAFMQCEYFSVTYGAGGSTRDRTLSLVETIQAEATTPVMPHMTCVAASREEIATLLDTYHAMGIRRLMALRGDMPSGVYLAGELQNACELVSFVRERWGDEAKVVVAAYPEIHPRAKSPQSDMHHFKEKMQAGANEAVTQYFFNADAYLRFRDEALAYGIDKPIVPGIMPITNYVQLARFSDTCGTEIPRWVRKRLEALRDDLPAIGEFGTEVITRLCERLLAEGVNKLHFYTMNRAEPLLEIVRALNLSR